MKISKGVLLFFVVLHLCEPVSCSMHDRALYSDWWQLSLGNSLSVETFASWLGDMNASTRLAMRKHVNVCNYTTLLDVPSGLCIDFFGLKRDCPQVRYYGLDVTDKLVTRAREQGIDVIKGDIESIPYADNLFDIVYSRHIFEHLPYYTKALDEVIRVAAKEVFIIFFLPPIQENDIIDSAIVDGNILYHNRYNKQKFENAVFSNKKVKSIHWEHVGNEDILHIYL